MIPKARFRHPTRNIGRIPTVVFSTAQIVYSLSSGYMETLDKLSPFVATIGALTPLFVGNYVGNPSKDVCCIPAIYRRYYSTYLEIYKAQHA